MQGNSLGAARDGGPVVLRPVRATPCCTEQWDDVNSFSFTNAATLVNYICDHATVCSICFPILLGNRLYAAFTMYLCDTDVKRSTVRQAVDSLVAYNNCKTLIVKGTSRYGI